ncbi:MAG: ParB N-terminal domain-containing protein [Thermodesulfobacteriota bacterium]
MEQNQPHGIEIEIAGLVPRYAHTRIVRPKALAMMAGSLERFGQINPVLVVVEEPLFVLIDGYLRVLSLKRLGRDTVMADVCEQGELKAYSSFWRRPANVNGKPSSRPGSCRTSRIVSDARQVKWHGVWVVT